MTEKKSLFAELIERRIPQIIGVYIATVWLAVEVSEWMSDRFDIPDQTSSYVFVIMIAFLPLVALLAWGHGRPGKDKWTQKQVIFIPFNIAIAWFAVNTFIKPEIQSVGIQGAEVQGIEILSLADVQTGELIDYEVAKTGLSQKVSGFFWENTTGDESLDWLSYGAMWMVSKDLMRNPIISIRTPYESAAMLRAITSKGYGRAIGEPLSLDMNIADDRDSQWMIKGRIRKEGEKIAFEASLYDVVTGALVTTISSAYDDWLFALDDMAEQLGTVILTKANIKVDANVIPGLAISEYISSDIEAIKLVVASLNSVNLDNDFEQGVGHIKAALSLDDKLAEAYVLLIDYYRGLGDFEAAKVAAEEALNLEYNLSQESALKVKSNYYAVSGESDKAIKVLENWVKLYPESADALQTLGSNYLLAGHRLDDALMTYQKLSELQEINSTSLVNQARIYRLKSDQVNAIKALNIYQSRNPDKAEPHLEMAHTYLQFGDIATAKSHFEEASLISINGIDADLGLAKIMSFEGDIESGLTALDELFLKAEAPSDQVKVLTEKENMLFLSGRLKEAMLILDQMQEISESYLPPLSQKLLYGSKQVSYLAYVKRFDEAWNTFNKMQEETKPPFDQMLEIIAMRIHELAGDHDKAAESLKRFEAFKQQFQMNIYDQFVLASQAVEARHSGDFEGALVLHDQAIEESSQTILTLNSLNVVDELKHQKALTLFEVERYQNAADVLEEVLSRNPILGQSILLKAKVLNKMGKFDASKAAIEQAKELWKNADVDHKDLVELKAFEQRLIGV